MSRSISFDDLLSEAIEVDGIRLDARVRAVVREVRGNSEIDYLDIGDVYISLPGHDLIMVDQAHFKSAHKTLYRRFENACELLALTKSKAAPEHKWTTEEVSA